MIPETSTSLLLGRNPVDILQVKDNMVRTARIHPALAESKEEESET
jgi:Mg2+/Co2+ transporter CorB